MRPSILAFLFVLLACARAFAQEPTPRAQALGFDAQRAMFLDVSDVPPGMHVKQEQRVRDPARGDDRFRALGGVAHGMQVFEGPPETMTFNLFEFRWVFPTEAAAKQYLDSEQANLAEGNPAIANAPVVGSDCHVYGGENLMAGKLNDLGAALPKMTNYVFLFRVRNVAVKLFGASLSDKASPKLTPLTLAAYAQKIVGRINRALDAPAPSSGSTKRVTLPVSGLVVDVPTSGADWDADKMAQGGGAVDVLKRTVPSSPRLMLVVQIKQGARCADEIQTLSTQGGRRVEGGLPDGWFPGWVVENLQGTVVSDVCSDTPKGEVLIMITQSLESPDGKPALPVLAAIARAAGAASTAPPPAPGPAAPIATPPPASPSSVEPRPRHTEEPDESAFSSEELPSSSPLALDLGVAQVRPASSSMAESTAFTVGADGLVIGGGDSPVGFAIAYGGRVGLDTKDDVQFDSHFALGVGLRLGPVTLVPLGGGGSDTIGGGAARSFHLPAAFYWYPGAVLRLRVASFGVEGYAARLARGSIGGDANGTVKREIRAGARLIKSMSRANGTLGFQLVDYDGKARSLGGTLGIEL